MALRFTLILLGVALVIQWVTAHSGLIAPPPSASLAVVVFMYGLTVLVFRIVSGISDRQRFTQVYLITVVIKILATCGMVVTLILLDKSNARANVVFLLILYALFTAIEVGFLVLAARANRS